MSPRVGGDGRTLVVAAASRHGATTAVAERIARVIGERLSPRWSIRTPDLADLRVLDDADAVVLGSAMHLGHWLRPALQLRRQAQDAQLLGLWLFSTGAAAHDLDSHPLVVSADGMVQTGRATDHRVFASSIDLSMSIDTWGADIADQLTRATSGTDVPTDGVRRPWADRACRTTLETSPPTESRTP